MVISTGNGIKYPDSVAASDLTTLAPTEDWSWPAG
jgi:hypothetical protein